MYRQKYWRENSNWLAIFAFCRKRLRVKNLLFGQCGFLPPAQHCLNGQNDKKSILKSSIKQRAQPQHSSRNSPLAFSWFLRINSQNFGFENHCICLYKKLYFLKNQFQINVSKNRECIRNSTGAYNLALEQKFYILTSFQKIIVQIWIINDVHTA